MEDNDTHTEWIEIKVPDHCDICGERSRKLRLIGGAKKREWLCPRCIKEAEQLLMNSDEFLQIRLDQRKAKEAAKAAAKHVVEREEQAEENRKKGVF